MVGEQTTFGCGTFLPGFGGGNFPDFDGGGSIDVPGGDDGPGDPIDPPTGGGVRPGDVEGGPPGPGPASGAGADTVPPGSGGGTPPGPKTGGGGPSVGPRAGPITPGPGGPSVGPGTGPTTGGGGPSIGPGTGPTTGGPGGPSIGPGTGPTTGGPGGPGTQQPPGTGTGPMTGAPPPPSSPMGPAQTTACRCTPQIPPHIIDDPGAEFVKIVSIRFTQECEEIVQGGPSPQSIVDSFVNQYLTDPDWDCHIGSQSGQLGSNCKEDGRCTGTCGPYGVSIYCTKRSEPASPTTTGGGGGGTPQPGTPASPTTPGGQQQQPPGTGTGQTTTGGGGPGTQIPPGPGSPPGPRPGGVTQQPTGSGVGPTTTGGGLTQVPPPPGTPPKPGPGVGGGGPGSPITPGAGVPGSPTGSPGGEQQPIGVGVGPTTTDGGGGGPGTQVPPVPGTPPGPRPGGGGPGSPMTPGAGVPGSPAGYGPDGPGNQTGTAISILSSWTQKLLLENIVHEGEVDLNDPILVSMILRQKPTGIEDSEVAFIRSPQIPRLVPNTSGNKQLFNNNIDSNVEYVLSNRKNAGNWDSRPAAGVTSETVYNSLKPEVQELLGQIRNYDGTPLTKNQIFSMIGTRILDGTVSKISLKFLQTLAVSSKKREPILVKRSSISRVNEVAALALVDRNIFTLDPAKATGVMKNILPNWKTLASDIDKYIEITIGGEVKKYYVKDDNTFINRSTLSLADGDYFDVKRGADTIRFYVKSEIDHAFLLPEKTRQKAIKLLGGEGGRTLKVSSDFSSVSGFEFDYSLSTPRQDFYMLSCVLSSINTKPNLVGSFLLKDSTMRYELMDTSTTQGLQDVNTFIKYKANHRVFILDDSDVMLDHIVGTSSLTIEQTDILFDSPKENKTIPLLTRQIPWYVMIYPTNRNNFNLFNSKSKVVELDTTGNITRQLRCKTTIVPNFSKQQTNKFIRFQTQGKTGTNVFGELDLQARITQVTGSDTVFQTGYKQNNKLVSAQDYKPSRKKTGLRLVKEIITELDTNYLLGLNGIGKSLTEFDVYSRLTLSQFNVLSRIESFNTIQNAVKNGLIANVKMIPPIQRANKRISFQHTQLVQRKVGAPADTFVSIKGTNNGQTIIPPTTTEGATLGPIAL